MRKWRPSAASPKGWLKLKTAPADRQALLDAQAEYDSIMAQMTPGHPVDIGKARWSALQAEYRKTLDPRILDQIDEIGHKGEKLTAQL